MKFQLALIGITSLLNNSNNSNNNNNHILLPSADGFTIPTKISSSQQQQQQQRPTKLYAQKQTRSSLLKPPTSNTNKSASSTTTAPPPKKSNDDDDSNEEVFGAKFFGGSAIKEELFDAELEAQADKLMKLYPKDASPTASDTDTTDNEENQNDVYYRFMDKDAFPDDDARVMGQRLQAAINQALYLPETDKSNLSTLDVGNLYSPSLEWNTPFARNPKSRTPLDELDHTLNFYKRIDVAIIAAKTTTAFSNESTKQMEVRWDVSLVWPNVFESSVLISGTSMITVDAATSSITSQTDTLDNGGKDGRDVIKAISSQLQPRFWDLYHIGMTPSAQLMPRVTPTTQSKGMFSSYELFEIPPRLVCQPTIVDTGGRETREAQSLPNHAFTSIIKTTGPPAQRYVPTSPVEVSIRRSTAVNDDGESVNKSIISWNIGLPPEYVSYYDEFSKLVTEEDKEAGNEPTNDFVYQPRRLVATAKYGGDVQDVEVTEIRKKLYEDVMKDGLKPKLENGRPQFFFLQNDAKACFTADGGLGMAVYDWRPEAANSNEVGIELEL